MPHHLRVLGYFFGLALTAWMVWLGATWAMTRVLGGSPVSPGDVAIEELSSAGADWVKFRNNTESRLELSGFVFTDGDNSFAFPPATHLDPGATLVIASSEDRETVPITVD